MLSSRSVLTIRLLKQSKFTLPIAQNYVVTNKLTTNIDTFKKCEINLCRIQTGSLQSYRNYAKGKDKKKEKGKTKVLINETQLAEVINLESIKTQMQKAVDDLRDDFIKHVSLRSTAGSLEMISVNFDGNEHTLQELAQIVRKNPKTIVVNMSVFPQAIPSVLKAIEKSGMNLNPQQDGTTLYIPIPKVTKDHRESLAKSAKQHFIKCRTAIKDVQMKYVKQVKKKEGLSEDLARNIEVQLTAIADNYLSQSTKMLDSKLTELIGNE